MVLTFEAPMATPMITVPTIPTTDNPTEARPRFLACLGSATAEQLAITVQHRQHTHTHIHLYTDKRQLI